MQERRIVTLALILAFVMVAALGGWIAGASIQSPAEAAARTAPPTPAPILVPVERRVLTSDIVVRGTARYGLPQMVALTPSTLKGNLGIITTLPSQGAQVQEGDLLLTASERPIFVLQGELPVYRDLVPGLAGKDVQQLEASLQRLGFDPGPVDGRYDEQTSAAVAAWYTAAGWPPFAPPATQLAQLQTLEEELAVAQNVAASATEASAAAPLAVAAARAQAERANKLANAAVVAATARHDQVLAGVKSTPSERATATAELAVAQAAATATQLEGEVTIQAALNAQKAAERTAQVAAARAARLAAELQEVKRLAGTPMPADELVFIAVLPVRVEQTSVTVGAAASGPVVTVTNNQLAIDSALPLAEAPLVQPGMAVTIDEPDLGIKATGVVAQVATSPGTNGADGYHFYFETAVDETPTTLAGFSLRLTIPVKSTRGPVIAVPISALALTADGRSTVQVSNNDGLETVVVEPGLSAAGFVEVTPLAGDLEPGQLVLVGYENQE